MKRSEINKILREAKSFMAEKKFLLPPWADWGLADCGPPYYNIEHKSAIWHRLLVQGYSQASNPCSTGYLTL